MKIVQVIDSLDFGGAERMAVNMANAFANETDRSVLVATRKSGGLFDSLDPQVKYHHLGKRSLFDIIAFYKLLRIIQIEKPDLLHAHSTSVFWCMLVKLFRPSTKVVWHHHLGLSDLVRAKPRPVIVWLSKWFHGALLVNKRLLDWAFEELRCELSRIAYIPNFSDIDPIAKVGLGFDKGIRILHLANFRDQKDHRNLLESLLILKRRGRQFKITLAGAHIDKQITAEIYRFVEVNGLDGYVDIVGPVSDIHTLLNSHNVGVLSSVSEGYPVSLIEYGMGQLYVVSTNAGQCADILGQGTYGCIAPIKDPVALADALEVAWIRPQECEHKAVLFQKKVVESHGKEGFMKLYKTTFFKV